MSNEYRSIIYIYIYLMNSSVFEKHGVFYSSSHQVFEKRRCNFKSCTTKSWYFLCCYSSGWLWLIDCYFDWMAQRRRAGGTNPKARCRSHSLSLDAEAIDRSWRRTPRTLISVAKGSDWLTCAVLKVTARARHFHPSAARYWKSYRPTHPAFSLQETQWLPYLVQGLEHKGLHGLRDGEGVWGN